MNGRPSAGWMQDLDARVAEIGALLGGADRVGYIGERTSQLGHALQAAAIAERWEDEELALAALLHDIGHLVAPALAPQMDGFGVVDHEGLGARWLRTRGFSPRLCRLVEWHVQAKRYLVAARPGYAEALSDASLATLEHQGGPMSGAEVAAFDADADRDAILRLRRADEAAKRTAFDAGALPFWLRRIRAHLQAQAQARPIPNGRWTLTAEQWAAWRRDGVIVLRDALTQAEADERSRWMEAMIDWPTSPGQWMRYDEPGADGPQLCRIENVLPYHDGLRGWLEQGDVPALLHALAGEPCVLFKEKVNVKLPGGKGFAPHQDAPAFAGFGQRWHITMLWSMDPTTTENGCVEFVHDAGAEVLLPCAADGTVDRDVVGQLRWEPVPVGPRDLCFFHSYVPHRSGDNVSTGARRGLYVTWNRASDGDRRDAYVADKRRKFPPQAERVAGVDYSAHERLYNLGNPIR